jgi:hypothetical protein
VQRLLEVPPQSKQNPDYGFSVGREAFRFAAGRWTTVAQRVRLNTPGQADGMRHAAAARPCLTGEVTGELQLWVDGKSVISVAGLRLRDARDSHVQGLHFQTFFGGASALTNALAAIISHLRTHQATPKTGPPAKTSALGSRTYQARFCLLQHELCRPASVWWADGSMYIRSS